MSTFCLLFMLFIIKLVRFHFHSMCRSVSLSLSFHKLWCLQSLSGVCQCSQDNKLLKLISSYCKLNKDYNAATSADNNIFRWRLGGTSWRLGFKLCIRLSGGSHSALISNPSVGCVCIVHMVLCIVLRSPPASSSTSPAKHQCTNGCFLSDRPTPSENSVPEQEHRLGCAVYLKAARDSSSLSWGDRSQK